LQQQQQARGHHRHHHGGISQRARTARMPMTPTAMPTPSVSIFRSRRPLIQPTRWTWRRNRGTIGRANRRAARPRSTKDSGREISTIFCTGADGAGARSERRSLFALGDHATWLICAHSNHTQE
jgi:hypothetical protein